MPRLLLGIAPGWERRLPRYAGWIAYGTLLGVMLGLVILSLVQAGNLNNFMSRSDVPAFYVGARIVLTGRSNHLYDMALQSAVHAQTIQPYGAVGLDSFVHPPWTALAFAPLGLLAFPAAYEVCGVLVLLLAAGCLRSIMARATHTSADPRLLWIVALGFPPLCFAFLLNQLPPMLVWLSLTAATSAFLAGRERTAGAWLVLGLIKPQLLLGLLVALVAARSRRALVVFALGTAAVGGVSALVFGNWLPNYLTFLTHYAQAGNQELTWKMQNWRGLVYHLLGSEHSVAALGLLGALTVVSLGAIVAICRPSAQRRGPAMEVRLSLAIILGLLVNPHVYIYDVVILLGPGFVLWRASVAGRADFLRGWLLAGPFVGLLAQFGPQATLIQIGPAYLAVLLLAVAWAWPRLGPAQQAVGVLTSS